MLDTKEIQKKESQPKAQVERLQEKPIFSPSVDIFEKGEEIILLADMPGVDEKSVEITLEKNVLTIRGEVHIDIPKEARSVYAEFGIGNFERTFTLSDEINKEKIEATVKNGVLKLILPKAEEAKAKKIQVRAEK